MKRTIKKLALLLAALGAALALSGCHCFDLPFHGHGFHGHGFHGHGYHGGYGGGYCR